MAQWHTLDMKQSSNAQLRYTTWHKDSICTASNAQLRYTWHNDTLRMAKGQHLHCQQCTAQTHMTWQTHYALHKDSICTTSTTLLRHSMQHNDRHILQNAQLRHTWHNVRNIRHDTRTEPTQPAMHSSDTPHDTMTDTLQKNNTRTLSAQRILSTHWHVNCVDLTAKQILDICTNPGQR